MLFSQRLWIIKVSDVIQIDDINEDLKNSLWNFLEQDIFQSLSWKDTNLINNLLKKIWRSFFKKPIDNMWAYASENIRSIKWWFYIAKRYSLYDIIEFCIEHYFYSTESKIKSLNDILITESSWYRFIDNRFIPVTEKHEIESIQKIIDSDTNTLWIVKNHIQRALKLLSDRSNPDYRNSIKESISAVESLSKMISWDMKWTLTTSLKKLKSKNIKIHNNLEEWFKSIYRYTSDGDGIRHALMEEEYLDKEDALYMLISCSSFINYLITKAEKAWIEIA